MSSKLVKKTSITCTVDLPLTKNAQIYEQPEKSLPHCGFLSELDFAKIGNCKPRFDLTLRKVLRLNYASFKIKLTKFQP